MLRPYRGSIGVCLLHADVGVLLQVHLVPCDADRYVVSDDLAQLLHPVLHAGERVDVRDVVHQQSAVGVAVVDRPERVEALLAGRVLRPRVELGESGGRGGSGWGGASPRR